MKHCCKHMETYLPDTRTNIKYNSIFREYYIKSQKALYIDNCPWCGTRLPNDLRTKFIDILEHEYGIETDVLRCWDIADLPAEFRTDEWWKKRGL